MFSDPIEREHSSIKNVTDNFSLISPYLFGRDMIETHVALDAPYWPCFRCAAPMENHPRLVHCKLYFSPMMFHGYNEQSA